MCVCLSSKPVPLAPIQENPFLYNTMNNKPNAVGVAPAFRQAQRFGGSHIPAILPICVRTSVRKTFPDRWLWEGEDSGYVL